MERATVVNRSKGVILASAWSATTRAARRRGLLDTDHLSPGDGLVIQPCRSVHTVGMHYPIDVLFIATDGVVVKAVKRMQPGRITWPAPAAHTAVELPAGTIDATGTQPGDLIEMNFGT